VLGEFPGELDSNRHTDEHAQPGLLGQERAHGGLPGFRFGLARGAADLLLVGAAEPPAVGEGLVEHALQLRRQAGDRVARAGEPLRVAECLDGRVDLLVAVWAVEHGVIIRP
jgi:molybdopterin-guanine dinucleotide biosynthesis protein A